MGFTGLGRLSGIALDGFQSSSLMWTFTCIELSAAVVSLWAQSRLPAVRPS